MQRYVITKKVAPDSTDTPEVLLDIEFTNKDEVIPKIRELITNGVNLKDTNAKIIDESDESRDEFPVSTAELVKMARKPRKDRSQPRKGVSEPAKRNRGIYFVVPRDVPNFDDKKSLDIYLDAQAAGNPIIIVQGYAKKVERRVQFKLEPVK